MGVQRIVQPQELGAVHVIGSTTRDAVFRPVGAHQQNDPRESILFHVVPASEVRVFSGNPHYIGLFGGRLFLVWFGP
jgi:hypothetical protein